MPTPPERFRNALRELSHDRFTAFVRAIWAARDYGVSREGSVLQIRGEDGERLAFPLAAGDRRSIPDHVDTIVTAEEPESVGEPDVNHLGPAELYELVRYAVPAEDGSRICAEHLDIELEEPTSPGVAGERRAVDASHGELPEPVPEEHGVATDAGADPGDSEGGETSAAVESPAPSRAGTRRAVLVGIGAFLAGVGIGPVTGIVPLGSADSSPDDRVSTPTPDPEPAVAVPGLSRDGVADPNALAEAHTNRLAASSFTVSSAQTAHASDGTLLSSLAITVRVGANRRYVAEFETSGPAGRPVFGQLPLKATLFSAGERQYRKLTTDGETTFSSAPVGQRVNGWFYWSGMFPFGALTKSAERFYRDLFDQVPVSVTSRSDDGRPPYRLDATDINLEEPDPRTFDLAEAEHGIADLDLLASVTAVGLVDSLRLDYEGRSRSDPVSVQISTEYRDLGDTTVSRPKWTERAGPN